MILPPRAATSCMLDTVFSNTPVVRRDHDHRHGLVDQRDRPVLELARGIALGVDVGDFLELQRAFERDRVSWCRGRDRARRCISRDRARAPRSAARARAPPPCGAAPRSARAPDCARPFRESMPRARPAAIARQASAASWQVNALVEATPISGPASVGITTSLSRAMVEVGTLTIGEHVLLVLAWRSAASPACRRSRPTATRRSRDRPATAAPRGSGTRRRHRSRPAGARSARTSISRPGRHNRRCRRRRSTAGRASCKSNGSFTGSRTRSVAMSR